MLRAGRHNHSRLLLLLFAVWVLFPFASLLWADTKSNHWPVVTRTTLYCVMLVVSLASLGIYGRVAFGPPQPKAAPPFVVVPPVSCLLCAVVVPAAAFVSRRFAKTID
jgi:peptidoglycan/LPS O-acetylase OafA/YrhL